MEKTELIDLMHPRRSTRPPELNMGFSFVYCVVCGCPFDIPPRDEVFDEAHNWASDDPLEDETKQWLCRVRLLGTIVSLEKFTTSPFRMPRNESTTQGLFISELADWAITEGLYFRLGANSYRVLAAAKDMNDVLFPLHDDCLTILKHVCDGSPSRNLTNVYKTLCAQFACNVQEKRRIAKEAGFYGSIDYMEYGLEFDHGYYGAREFWASEGWEPTKANEWYCSDPINVQNLPDYISKLLAERPSEVREDTELEFSTLKTPPRSRLEHLPQEITDLVASFLPTPSILRLRMCSKNLMSRIVLDQQFWRKQLLDSCGCAVPYLWDLEDIGQSSKASGATFGESPGNHDWKGLARMLARRDDIMKGGIIPSPPWGLRNRCRIWALATYLVASSES